jgi:HD-like signal output (HDOD) protein
MREVAAITFELGLRAAFPPAPELEPLWQRAALRGLMMGRHAQRLGLDAWGAHSAGLFEECGKAVLFRHAPAPCGALWRAAANDSELVMLERERFGVSHEALGAALCDSWGLNPAAVASVRHHVAVQAGGAMPAEPERRSLVALSAVAACLMHEPEALEAEVEALALAADLDHEGLLRAARLVHEQLRLGAEHGRLR